MAPPTNTLQDSVSAWLAGWLTKARLPTRFQVMPLAGDGSPRPFYRIKASDKTFVLLFEPSWTLSRDYPAHQAYLKSRKIPVPEFLAVDPSLGVLLMEDLGDELLQTRILAEPQNRLTWLTASIELLADLHGSTFPVPVDLPVATRRFDSAKYEQEMDFLFEHLHVGLLKLPPPGAEIRKEVEGFCKTLEQFRPSLFCHRDYHTRNLLVHAGTLRLIDFQDARLGPAEYDLASLFYDAYVPVTDADRTQLLEAYRLRLKRYALYDAMDWKELDRRLNLVAYQRVLKAAGSFASFYTRYGKKTHLPYLEPALRMALALKSKIGEAAPSVPIERWLSKLSEVPR